MAEKKPYDPEEDLFEFFTKQKADPSVTHPGKQFFLDLLDAFDITSPNGTHRVLVTNVVRTIYDYHPISESGWGLVAHQLTSALDFLHTNQITHLDLQTQNVGYAYTLTDDMVASLPEHDEETLVDHEGIDWTNAMPRVMYGFVNWLHWTDDVLPRPALTDFRIQILDFGEAHSPHCPDPRTSAKTVYDVPEVRLGGKEAGLGPGIDIWCLAHLVFTCEFGRPVFIEPQSRLPAEYARRLKYMANNLQDWPENLRARYEELKGEKGSSWEEKSFNGDIEADYPMCECETVEHGLYEDEDGEFRDTEDGIRKIREHLAEFWRFFRRAAALDPQARPSARELLDEPYLNRWKLAQGAGSDEKGT